MGDSEPSDQLPAKVAKELVDMIADVEREEAETQDLSQDAAESLAQSEPGS